MREYILNKPAVAAWKARHKQTDEMIAKAIGASYPSWCRWLNGHSPIPLNQLMALAVLMEIENPRDLVEERLGPPPQRRDHVDVRSAEQVLADANLPGQPHQRAKSA